MQLVSSTNDQPPPWTLNPIECSGAGIAADPPGSWPAASWGRCSLSGRDGVLAGRPGPGYRAAASGPEGSGKPSADPRGPQPGPSSRGPGGGGTGNSGTLAGSVGGAAESEQRPEITGQTPVTRRHRLAAWETVYHTSFCAAAFLSLCAREPAPNQEVPGCGGLRGLGKSRTHTS